MLLFYKFFKQIKMKILSFLSAVFILTFFITGCNGKSGSQAELSGDTLKAGEKAVFSENGKLHYIIESKDGKTNGRVREYTPDGKLYMDAIYKNDHRNGKCTFYYKNGKPFSVCYYIHGAKDSIDTKYSEDGRVLAFVPYKNDKVQPGLKEFEKDGSLIPVNNTLIISEVDHSALEGRYYLKVSLAKPRKNVKFYASPQTDPDSRELLKISGDAGILEVPIPPGGFVMKKLILEAQYKTSMGNTMRLQRFYDLAIDR
jgi:antitoxin component YwqK of YwqJK toxin-antitoxin module